MPRQKKGLTKEEKLAKDRLRKKSQYAEIKNNPELYAIQKEKERKRYLLRKEKKKICSIKDMTPRAQREQRKRWRKNARNYLNKKNEQKRIENILINNSPPESEEDMQGNEVNMQDPLESPSTDNGKVRTCRLAVSSLLRKMRYRHQKVVKELKEEIIKLKKEKKQLSRKMQVKKKVNLEDTIEKKVNQLVTDIKIEKVEEVKKKLLFSETLTRDMTQGYKSLKKKEKRVFAETLIKSKEKLKRYKILNKIPFRLRDHKLQRKPNVLEKKIQLFFEEDTNSRVAAGKKEYVKRDGIKKQKRYITDNLKNLHESFLKEQCQVSYSTFCKYRPYWVVSPDNNRDTCLCKLHSNIDLLLKALKKANIIKEGSGYDMIKSICCDSYNNICLERTCQRCKNKELNFLEFRNDEKVTYFEWVIEKQKYIDKNGKSNLKTISTKKKFDDYPLKIIQKLDAIQNTYLKHCYNIAVQHSSIKQLKNNLKDNEIIIHIDFSENYFLKYNEEIQSFHFGGSRGQVSLHTGVFYYLDNQTGFVSNKSFCTLSQNTNHDAGAIWAHLTPILKLIQNLIPNVTTIHFLSDSPSSQYRNKFIFYLITKLKYEVKFLNKVTWNYQEAGHGKGAPDGVGAVVKRTADNFVKYGGDVGSFEAFVEIIKSRVRNIHVEIISTEEIEKNKFPPYVTGFKGTMKVHQVIIRKYNEIDLIILVHINSNILLYFRLFGASRCHIVLPSEALVALNVMTIIIHHADTAGIWVTGVLLLIKIINLLIAKMIISILTLQL